MTGIMKNNYQLSELTGTHSGVRMKFWGISCVGGKAYKQEVNYTFHLTMAVLDPKSFDRDVRDRTVTLSVIQHGKVFLLCVLKHGEIQQVSLNLLFDKEDDVMFTVNGYGTVHLTGYSLIDSSDSALGMDNEYYCPVVELGSEKRRKRSRDVMIGNNKERKLAKLMKANVEDDDDEEDDSDFSINKEGIEESDEEDSDDDDDDNEDDSEIDEEELQFLRGEAEIETPPRSEGSQKRKFERMSQSKKGMKMENSQLEENDEVMHIEDNESNSDQGGLNCSIGNTPMPKKLDDSAKAKKKLKKKKRLSEISMLNKSVKNDDVNGSPFDKSSTPKSPADKKERITYPPVTVEGGVVYQDTVIGKGPVAADNKIVSVFYMGRLENSRIIDSRTPPKKPFSFKLGVPEVIKGLDVGIKGMKVGGQRKVKIPPKMGYGAKGASNVPPNSTLHFSVELVNVK